MTGIFFEVVETTTNQVVGGAFPNHVARHYQMANLGCSARTLRWEKELPQKPQNKLLNMGNTPGRKVAEKIGASKKAPPQPWKSAQFPCDAYMHSLIPADYAIDKTA